MLLRDAMAPAARGCSALIRDDVVRRVEKRLTGSPSLPQQGTSFSTSCRCSKHDRAVGCNVSSNGTPVRPAARNVFKASLQGCLGAQRCEGVNQSRTLYLATELTNENVALLFIYFCCCRGRDDHADVAVAASLSTSLFAAAQRYVSLLFQCSLSVPFTSYRCL